MFARIVTAIFVLLVSLPALAQSPPPVDARLAPSMVQALQGLLALREAEIKAQAEDMKKLLSEREAAWTQYSKPLWEPKEPPK